MHLYSTDRIIWEQFLKELSQKKWVKYSAGMWSGTSKTQQGNFNFLLEMKRSCFEKTLVEKNPKNSHFQLKQNNSNGSLSTIFHNLLVLLLITFLFHAAAFIDLLSVPAVSCYFTVCCVSIYSLHSLQQNKDIIELHPTGHLISQSHILNFWWSFTVWPASCFFLPMPNCYYYNYWNGNNCFAGDHEECVAAVFYTIELNSETPRW